MKKSSSSQFRQDLARTARPRTAVDRAIRRLVMFAARAEILRAAARAELAGEDRYLAEHAAERRRLERRLRLVVQIELAMERLRRYDEQHQPIELCKKH
jgi:hypothetical protein